LAAVYCCENAFDPIGNNTLIQTALDFLRYLGSQLSRRSLFSPANQSNAAKVAVLSPPAFAFPADPVAASDFIDGSAFGFFLCTRFFAIGFSPALALSFPLCHNLPSLFDFTDRTPPGPTLGPGFCFVNIA